MEEKKKNRKNRIFQHLNFSLIFSWLVSFGVCIYIQYLFDAVRNKVLLELIKRRWKVKDNSLSCERALNFD